MANISAFVKNRTQVNSKQGSVKHGDRVIEFSLKLPV